MSDYLVRVLGKQAGVRGIACVTTELVKEAARRHQATPIVTAVLGQGLTAAVLLGALLKVRQRVALKIDSNGPVRKIVAESDSYGNVRGYVTANNVLSAQPISTDMIAQVIGNQGRITVVKDLRLKNLSESIVPLQTGYLDADITYYLNQSEQTPSVVEFGVKVDDEGNLLAAGGLLLQTLPDASETTALKQLSERLDDLPMLENVLADGRSPNHILATVFQDIEYEWLEERALQFRCSCSRQRSEHALSLLTAEDMEDLIKEGEAVVDCHFCHERYVFDRSDLQRILKEMRATS